MVKKCINLFLLVFVCLVTSCEEEEYNGGSMVLSIKDKIFIQYAKAKTFAGNRATIANSREELVDLVGEDVAQNAKLNAIDFSNSTFVFDSDTIINTIPNYPDVVTMGMMRGLSGNYSFSYYIETQKSGDETKDRKRDFIIGVVVDKLPQNANVFLDANLNYKDSVFIPYPMNFSIEKY